MLWCVGGALILVWFILYIPLHKTGWIHLLLLSGLSLLLVQTMAYRKTKYQERVGRK